MSSQNLFYKYKKPCYNRSAKEELSLAADRHKAAQINRKGRELQKMKKYKIAVIAGDGIGPEVIGEGVRVLERVAELDRGFGFEFTHFPWGCEYYLETGKMMPDDAIATLSEFDAIYLGREVLCSRDDLVQHGCITSVPVVL